MYEDASVGQCGVMPVLDRNQLNYIIREQRLVVHGALRSSLIKRYLLLV